MKDRDYKLQGENVYFHIYNRGNRKENIFLDDEDFNFFILRLKQNLYPELKRPRQMRFLPEDSFSLIAYCLLPNHFHLLIRQNKDVSVGKFMLKVATSYSMYFNKKYDKVGHVFQDEFKQKVIDSDSYLKWLCAYVHQNPQLHNYCKAGDYRWSSYKEFLNPASPDKICDASIVLGQFNSSIDFHDFVEDNLEILKQNKNIKKFCYD